MMMYNDKFLNASIQPFIQKIFYNKRLWGGEILCRVIDNNEYISPLDLLDKVRKHNLEYDFDVFIIEKTFQHLNATTFKNISVNINPKTISDVRFYKKITRLIDQYIIDASIIILELTELSSFNDDDIAIKNIQQLRLLGIRFSIDDFGYKHSNFDRLERYHTVIDYIKINNLIHDSDIFFTGMLSVFKFLNDIEVIAEHVEDENKCNQLFANNIKYHQGYYYHKPVYMGSI